LYRNRVTVHLAPAAITVVTAHRGWRPHTPAAVTIPVAVSTGLAWQDSLAALHTWLEQASIAPAELRVTLADSFVRYALVPWSDEVQHPRERAALARIRFDALYGKPDVDWLIRSDLRDYRQAGIACALDPSLEAAVRALAATHRLRLASLQPLFMDVFNRFRHVIAGDTLLVVAEAGHCVLASRKDGGWHSIRAARLEPGRVGLAQLAPRELLLQGLDGQVPVLLHADGSLDVARLQQVVNLRVLDQPDPGADARAADAGGPG
jgi:hypothetical protein